MTRSRADSRSRLVEAALKTTYRSGFSGTSLADIAKEARVPLGNVYYHFRTKDAIGDAIIERRLARFRKLLRELEAADAPEERLCAFVQVKIKNRDSLARLGCPVGTLLSELHKNRSPVAPRSTELFAEALGWMEVQFRALGQGAASRGLAVHLLSALQGVSLLAHTFHDPGLIDAEAARLKEWLRGLGKQGRRKSA